MSIDKYWDHINEYEVDPSWREFQTAEYLDYRNRWEQATDGKYLGDFPLSLEVEPTYYCNLKCPFCPREVLPDERLTKHMAPGLWKKIVNECARKELAAIQMPHEAEALMNPAYLQMLKDQKAAAIKDIWLHTNANMLTPSLSADLIDAGLTKINFSLDAATEDTYKKLRVGGKFHKTIQNVERFLQIKLEKGAHYLRTRVSFVEQEENFHEKQQFFEFWHNKKGLNLITFQHCMDLSGFEKPDEDVLLSEDELTKKYQDEKPFFCSAPWETPTIDVDGNVAPCLRPVREHSKDFFLGNLNNGASIESCWNSEKMNSLRELHKKGEWYKNDMCRICVKSMRGAQTQQFDV